MQELERFLIATIIPPFPETKSVPRVPSYLAIDAEISGLKALFLFLFHTKFMIKRFYLKIIDIGILAI